MIDEKTGLPELPSKYFWRVKETSVCIQMPLDDTGWSERCYYPYLLTGSIDSDESYKTETRTVDVEVEREEVGGGFWPWSNSPKVKAIEKRTEYRRVERSLKMVEVFTEYTGAVNVYPVGYDYSYTRGYYYYKKPDIEVKVREKVTRENLMALCEKALVELDGISLRGDYPPKRLEAGN